MNKQYNLKEFLDLAVNGYNPEDWEVTWGFVEDWAPLTNKKILEHENSLLFRKKVKTIICNGFTVNAAMSKEPKNWSQYFYPDLTNSEFYEQKSFDSEWDCRLFDRGLCFSNKEDAIAMAKAMLGIDPAKPD